MAGTSGSTMFWGATAGLIAALGAGLLLAAPAKAADMPRKAPLAATAAGDRCAKVEPAPGTPSVPGGDIFGITSPTDIGDPCSWAFASEFTGRGGKRDGSYFALTDKNQFTYTFSNRLAFAFSPFVTHTRWANVSAIDPVGGFNGTDFDGVSGEIFYRILARSPGQPVAITLSSEPRWARVDGLTGWRAESYSNEFKIFMDVALTERIFAAMNLNYALARARLDQPGAVWVDSSSTNVSGALTAQVYAQDKAAIEAIFFGVEGRLLSAYSGLALNQKMWATGFSSARRWRLLFRAGA